MDNERSRYFATVIDNSEIQNLTTINSRDINSDDYPKDGSMMQIFETLSESSDSSKNNLAGSLYFLRFYYIRFQRLSWLPFALFHIANCFINDLSRIQKTINDLKNSSQIALKIKWLGKKTHIGYIFSMLAQEGYIDAPKSKNGEINYTAFAKLIKELFDVDVTEGTLRKYLNPDDDKFVENKNTFEREKFFLPNVKLVN